MNDNSKHEKQVQELLEESLRKFGSSTSIDSDYDLIKEILNENDEKLSQTSVNSKQRAWKPNLNRFPDACVLLDSGTTIFVPEVGDKIAIEFANDWQDTAYGIVKFIDYETGNFRIWSERKSYHVMSNFFDKSLIFKLAPKNIGSLRSKSKKIQVKSFEDLYNEDSNKSRGRGRPKGSKNRSKNVIVEEKKKNEDVRRRKIEKKALRERMKLSSNKK